MENKTRDKLWTSSFFILWQGQLVSTIGDAVYSIALGFWVLATTGSTALMGTLMAASTLPGVLVSPFAGVLIDRSNKKRLFILMDMLRGVCMLLVAAAAHKGMLAIWMVFAAGILLSICGAVFGPGVQSTVPDLVPKSKITNANSVFSIVSAGSNMLGNVAGGLIYQALGAPLLFLFNGISFLFSGATMPFVKIPRNTKNEKVEFLKDMLEGFKFMWQQKGLRTILVIAALSNFFSFIGIVLFLPLFQSTSYLGAGKYGVAMACFMGGAMLGFMFMSIITIKFSNKMKIFITSGIIFNLTIIIAVRCHIFVIMALFLILSGFFNSVFNVLIISTVQVSTPQEVRGKVMSFLNMISQGLTPFAMALGGVLGEIFPIKAVISFAFIVVFVITIPSYFSKDFREYLIADYGDNKEEAFIGAEETV